MHYVMLSKELLSQNGTPTPPSADLVASSNGSRDPWLEFEVRPAVLGIPRTLGRPSGGRCCLAWVAMVSCCWNGPAHRPSGARTEHASVVPRFRARPLEAGPPRLADHLLSMALKAHVTNPPASAMADLLPSPPGQNKASGERNGLVGSKERERTRDLERKKRGEGGLNLSTSCGRTRLGGDVR
jgi:hypothetical protein